jgi:hypothetical protein
MKASEYVDHLKSLSDDELENERYTWESEWEMIGEAEDRASLRVELAKIEQHRRTVVLGRL